MYRDPVGVSILTNASRRHYLERCVDSFLANCYYRPLVFCIYSNGSTDDTEDWIQGMQKAYGVEWRLGISHSDGGCARGTNASIEMACELKYQIHLESDFEHLSPAESGVDRMWLHRALEFMESAECDYMYLRRMRDEKEMMMHWWSQWMPKVDAERTEYLRCPGFWWSNNSTLFRNEALYGCGTLPLDEAKDGAKGSDGWSQPELTAARPPNAWIHKWGMFVHERMPGEDFTQAGCGAYGPFGRSGCKYGFWGPSNAWCGMCDHSRDFRDMDDHKTRYFNK
jgi:glycosyltransferase involved in cell wall biosynthesis